ncbi:MAG: tRNA (guanosine(46)-N7)-methyltransferase TrmB [Pseudomonadota bacterium]
MSTRKQRLIDECLPQLQIEVSETAALDPRTYFENALEIWLEIGFGGGEHVSGQARRSPEIGILASEVFSEGVAKLLSQIEENQLSNIRLWPRDGRELIDGLVPECIDRAYILFPDPWPKTKHHKRRLIQPVFLDSLARVIKPNGRVRFATDVRSYADEAMERFLAHPDFQWSAATADDWRIAPEDHIETRYQAKNLGDVSPVYFDFQVKSKI